MVVSARKEPDSEAAVPNTEAQPGTETQREQIPILTRRSRYPFALARSEVLLGSVFLLFLVIVLLLILADYNY
jgi:hypothetical protein